MITNGTIHYQQIKDLAKTHGLKAQDLIALAPVNDPFYCGRPGQVKAAEWFAQLWQRFGYGQGVHLRRVHYQIVSQDPPVTRPDGQPYANTDKDWGYLCNAGKFARYLGLIDPQAFVDRRNPEAVLNTTWLSDNDLGYISPDPTYTLPDTWDDWEQDRFALPELPSLDPLPWSLPDPPRPHARGYTTVQQGVHLEVWCEKTTMNDVLLPVCQQYQVNLITGAGEMSITAVVDFMRRVDRADRPARILYISDYDPAGHAMPVSVSRKIEHFQRNEGFGHLDIQLQPIVLTADQVAAYDLPRTPIKASDRRKENWQSLQGEGAVELDALEALHPGVLHTIVEETLLDYYDPTLPGRAQNALETYQYHLNQASARILDDYQAQLDELEDQYNSLYEAWTETSQAFDEMVAPFKPQLEQYRATLEGIVQAHQALITDFQADLADTEVTPPDVPQPNLPPETHNPLYASDRDYLTQLDRYKVHRGLT